MPKASSEQSYGKIAQSHCNQTAVTLLKDVQPSLKQSLNESELLIHK